MNVWVMVLVVGGVVINPKMEYDTKDKCIEQGQQIIQTYKTHFKHSTAWFWCYKEERL